MSEVSEAARRAIARALHCAIDALTPEAGIGTLPEWDSIGHVNIVLEVETELGAKLASEEIAAIGSVSDVIGLYQRHSTSGGTS